MISVRVHMRNKWWKGITRDGKSIYIGLESLILRPSLSDISKYIYFVIVVVRNLFALTHLGLGRADRRSKNYIKEPNSHFGRLKSTPTNDLPNDAVLILWDPWMSVTGHDSPSPRVRYPLCSVTGMTLSHPTDPRWGISSSVWHNETLPLCG